MLLWTLFAAALIVTIAAAWYLSRPLAGEMRAASDEERHQLELMRARLLAQLNELDLERADRGVDPATAEDESRRLEAELAMVLKQLDAQPPPAAAASTTRGRRNVGLALLFVSLALLAAGLYGHQQGPLLSALYSIASGEDPPAPELPPEALAMVARLEARLKEKPNDPTGWAALGRSYAVMERRAEAQAAYAKAHALSPGNAEILSEYAWLVYSDNPHYTEGPAKALYQRLLELDPKHPDALWFLGLSAINKGDKVKALRHWETLAATLPPDSPALPEIRNAIARVKERPD